MKKRSKTRSVVSAHLFELLRITRFYVLARDKYPVFLLDDCS